MIVRDAFEEFLWELSDGERRTLKSGYWSQKMFQKFTAFFKTLSEEEKQAIEDQRATLKDVFDEVLDKVVRERQN
jgi:hypothetical protein